MTPVPARPPQVSVVVPNHNGAGFLAGCLDSLRLQTHPELEVIVVDDASTDGSRALVRERFPEFGLIELDRNQGFCAACNAGVAAARGEFVALVNSDAVLPPEFVSRLTTRLRERARAWVAAPWIDNRNLDMSRYPGGGTLSVTGIIIQNVFCSRADIFGAPGAALVYRKAALGLPFDPEYRFFHDDVYLSWRAWLNGGEVVSCPEVVVTHLGSASVMARPWRNRWLSERNRWLNALTLWSGWTLLRLLPLWGLALGLELAADLCAGRGWGPRLLAYGWFLVHPRKVWRKRRTLQRTRRVHDREVLRLMSCRITNLTHAPARAANALARIWCRWMGLVTWELQEAQRT